MNINRSLAAVAAATLLVAGLAGVADAKSGGPKCKTSSTQTVQVRNVSGVVIGMKDGQPVYGSGTQSRTKTVVTSTCAVTKVTYTAWV